MVYVAKYEVTCYLKLLIWTIDWRLYYRKLQFHEEYANVQRQSRSF